LVTEAATLIVTISAQPANLQQGAVIKGETKKAANN